MSKRRKTRQQKIISELRQKLHTDDNHPAPTKEKNLSNSLSYSYTHAPLSTAPVSKNSITTTTYPYLIHDLKRTGLLLGAIMIIEILLFILLKNHIIKLPMLSY